MAKCSCGSGEERRELKDGYGIFCAFVCDSCESDKKAMFREDIFNGPYDCTEEIEEPD